MAQLDPSIPRLEIPADEKRWSGRIQLLVAGFSGQDVVSVPQVARAVEILPDHHLEHLRVVRFDPTRRYQRLPGYYGVHEPPSNAAGIYDVQGLGIVLFSFASRLEFYSTLYHEIGHFVYYHVIGHDLKHEWVMAVNYATPPVSDYAGTNAREGFAETYEWFVLHRAELARDPLKHGFFLDRVFRGFVPDTSGLEMP